MTNTRKLMCDMNKSEGVCVWSRAGGGHFCGTYPYELNTDRPCIHSRTDRINWET